MKSLTRVAFYALILSIVPLSYSHADDSNVEEEEEILTLEEAKALIDSRATANDALGGLVGPPSDEIYDFYSRQLSYREKTKAYRASLEVRRVAFEEPRTPLIEAYKDIQNRVYRAETAAYQESLLAYEESLSDEEPQESGVSESDEEIVVPDIMESSDNASEEVDKPLKEMDVPTDVANAEDDQDVKKKVITSDDAPDFDPANL